MSLQNRCQTWQERLHVANRDCHSAVDVGPDLHRLGTTLARCYRHVGSLEVTQILHDKFKGVCLGTVTAWSRLQVLLNL